MRCVKVTLWVHTRRPLMWAHAHTESRVFARDDKVWTGVTKFGSG